MGVLDLFRKKTKEEIRSEVETFIAELESLISGDQKAAKKLLQKQSLKYDKFLKEETSLHDQYLKCVAKILTGANVDPSAIWQSYEVVEWDAFEDFKTLLEKASSAKKGLLLLTDSNENLPEYFYDRVRSLCVLNSDASYVLNAFGHEGIPALVRKSFIVSLGGKIAHDIQKEDLFQEWSDLIPKMGLKELFSE